jgi:hypothetical protein
MFTITVAINLGPPLLIRQLLEKESHRATVAGDFPSPRQRICAIAVAPRATPI